VETFPRPSERPLAVGSSPATAHLSGAFIYEKPSRQRRILLKPRSTRRRRYISCFVDHPASQERRVPSLVASYARRTERSWDGWSRRRLRTLLSTSLGWPVGIVAALIGGSIFPGHCGVLALTQISPTIHSLPPSAQAHLLARCPAGIATSQTPSLLCTFLLTASNTGCPQL
jgi:hypothetical protein